jgi:hypothetical protein
MDEFVSVSIGRRVHAIKIGCIDKFVQFLHERKKTQHATGLQIRLEFGPSTSKGRDWMVSYKCLEKGKEREI